MLHTHHLPVLTVHNVMMKSDSHTPTLSLPHNKSSLALSLEAYPTDGADKILCCITVLVNKGQSGVACSRDDLEEARATFGLLLSRLVVCQS